jgi:hypothetical protein
MLEHGNFIVLLFGIGILAVTIMLFMLTYSYLPDSLDTPYVALSHALAWLSLSVIIIGVTKRMFVGSVEDRPRLNMYIRVIMSLIITSVWVGGLVQTGHLYNTVHPGSPNGTISFQLSYASIITLTALLFVDSEYSPLIAISWIANKSWDGLNSLTVI